MLTRIQEEFGVAVVAIDILPQYYSLQEWQAYLKDYGASDFVVAQDTPDQLAVQAYQIRTLGTTVIVDRKGGLVYRDETTSTYEMLREGVQEALD